MTDPSNGYEAIAARFLAGRGSAPPTAVGASQVREWARTLPPRGSVLDLGCGSGLPITQALVSEGLDVCAIDASPTLVKAFRSNFPDVPVACESAVESVCFGRKFDGVVAWGLMFLLEADDQRRLIRMVRNALVPGGRFLFTSPHEPCIWNDVMTGLESRSLGTDEYRKQLADAGFVVIAQYEDAGQNCYFDAEATP